MESAEVVYVATPDPERVAGEPSALAPSMNCTVPVDALGVAVAVNVTEVFG